MTASSITATSDCFPSGRMSQQNSLLHKYLLDSDHEMSKNSRRVDSITKNSGAGMTTAKSTCKWVEDADGVRHLNIDAIKNGSLHGQYTALSCRNVAVGSYVVVPDEKVIFSTIGFKMCVPSCKNERKIVTLSVDITDIVEVQAYLGQRVPVLFLDIHPSAASRVRSSLEMVSHDDPLDVGAVKRPYFDPSSEDDTQKLITILLPDILHSSSKEALRSIFSAFGILDEINYQAASALLAKSYPKPETVPVVKQEPGNKKPLVTENPEPRLLADAPFENISSFANVPKGADGRLHCRVVYVGSFRSRPLRDVFVYPNGFRMTIRDTNHEMKPVTIFLHKLELVCVMAYFGRELPALFLQLLPSTAERIRDFLGMKSRSGPYYDPTSSDDTQKLIIFLLEEVNSETKKLVDNCFGRSNLLEVLTFVKANDILLRSCGRKVPGATGGEHEYDDNGGNKTDEDEISILDQCTKQVDGSGGLDGEVAGRRGYQVHFTNFVCQMLRIGSYENIPTEKVLVTNTGMWISIPAIQHGSEIVNFAININDIAKAQLCILRPTPIIFLYLHASAAEGIRTSLKMMLDRTPYYDPESQDDVQKYIIFVPEYLAVKKQEALTNIFREAGVLEEICLKTAFNIMRAACPSNSPITQYFMKHPFVLERLREEPMLRKAVQGDISGGAVTTSSVQLSQDSSYRKILRSGHAQVARLQYHTAFIGSYKNVETCSEPVTISSRGVEICLPTILNEKQHVKFQIYLPHILEAQVHFGSEKSLLFLDVFPSAAVSVRNSLGMISPTGQYYDPTSKDENQRLIKFFLRDVSKKSKEILKSIFGGMNILRELNSRQVKYVTGDPQQKVNDPLTSISETSTNSKTMNDEIEIVYSRMDRCTSDVKKEADETLPAPVKEQPSAVHAVVTSTPTVSDGTEACIDADAEAVLEESTNEQRIQFACQNVLIGSYKVLITKDITVSACKIEISAPTVGDGGNTVSVSLAMKDIVKVLTHFGQTVCVLFIQVHPNAAERIRNALKMKSDSGPYFDPTSKDDTKKLITLLPKNISVDSKMKLKHIFATMNILQVLSTEEAFDTLLRLSSQLESAADNASRNICVSPEESNTVTGPALPRASQENCALPEDTSSASDECIIIDRVVASVPQSSTERSRTKLEQQPSAPKAVSILKRNRTTADAAMQMTTEPPAAESAPRRFAFLQCRSVRIGSYHSTPSREVVVCDNGVQLCVPSIENGDEPVTLSLNIKEILQVLTHFTDGISVVIFYVQPLAAERIRNLLKMKSNSGPYYDPTSQDGTQKFITLSFSVISDANAVILKHVFLTANILQELSAIEANILLLQIRNASVPDSSEEVTRTLPSNEAALVSHGRGGVSTQRRVETEDEEINISQQKEAKRIKREVTNKPIQVIHERLQEEDIDVICLSP